MFTEMDPWYTAMASWAYVAAVAISVVSVLLRKKEPASALGWSLAIVFLPGVGLGLYLLVGWNRIAKPLHKKILHRLAFSSQIDEASARHTTTPDEHLRPPQSKKWGTVEKLLIKLDQGPRRTGNSVQLYQHGVVAFEAMERAILAAEHHIHIEFFIFRDDQLGRRATEALVKKAREGVEVRVLVDGIGSRGNRRLLKALRQAGGEGFRFLPVRLLGLFGKATPHLRNHRKIVICDGKVAFFGGLNVGVEYLGRRVNRGRDWFDLHVRLEGPSVWDLQEVFLEDWDFASGHSPPSDPYFPLPQISGGAPVQIIAGGPDQQPNAIRQALIAGFARATSSIRIFTPYLVPDRTLRDAMMTAARAGITVEVITQMPPADHPIVHLCGEYFMEELLAAGVKIFGYQEGMMHAKAVTIDEEWAMIGTANLDNRSLQLNFEQMAILDGAEEVAALEKTFANTKEHCRPYSTELLQERSAPRRLLSNVARLLAPIL